MKVLIYGINFAPELTGIGKYSSEQTAWLSSQGHEVRVVTAPPYYPAWSVKPGYTAGRYQHERLAEARVWRCPLWVPFQPGGAKRLVHLASFAISSVPVMLRQLFWRPDVVWVVAPAFFCAPMAWLLARLCGAKCWIHIQDFEVDAAFDMGLLKGRWLRAFAVGAERWMFRRFDRVSTISGRMHARLLAKGVSPAKALLAPNWVQVDAFGRATPEQCSAMRQRLGVPQDAVLALYSGNMGAKQGLEVLSEVAKLLQGNSNMAPHAANASVPWFVFCGAGPGRAVLESACAGLPQVRFADLQPAEDLPALLANADIHLLPQRADAADLVMPSKLTGMLASARPVVATAHPGTELASVVQGCGLVVPPEDAAAMAEAVLKLAASPDLRKKLGESGLAYAMAHLDKEAVLRKFESNLIELVSEK